ncbi:MAG: sugar ABC transporter permease [Chloroflexota bacterium]
MATRVSAGSIWRSRARRGEALWGYGLVSIWFIGFAAFTAVPLGMSVFIGFTNWSPISGPFWNAHTVGFSNYSTFLQDHRYWHSVWNTLYFAIGSVGLVNLVSIPMALMLNQKLRGINLYRTIFYLPAIMPAVATVLIFRLMFVPGTGLISWVLTRLHLQCDVSSITCNPVDWFSDPRVTMLVVIIISAWGVGQTLLIYLAGLQGIDRTYYEAASIDGATSAQQFRKITLPLLTPAIFFNVVVGLIGAFQEFTKFVIYAGGSQATGGPDDSLLTTFWYLYLTGFSYQKMGLATAMAFGLFALILIVTVIQFLGQRRWVFYQEERQ